MIARGLLLLYLVLLSVAPATAERSQTIAGYTVHYSVVTSTFIEPDVAARYGIVRGRERALINIALRHTVDGKDMPSAARLEGRTWDLFQNQFLEFQEIREQQAIYYIAEFEFTDSEWRFFNLNILPEGAEQSFPLNFKQRVYVD